jgi:hypothetical protein
MHYTTINASGPKIEGGGAGGESWLGGGRRRGTRDEAFKACPTAMI